MYTADQFMQTVVVGKLTQCFDMDGSTVVVAVPLKDMQQARDTEPPREKMPRLSVEFKEFKVWSALLCSWSEVFDAMLNGVMMESSGRVEIVDFSVEAVEASLRFMYGGKLEVEPARLVEVAAFAEKYAISDLKGISIAAWIDQLGCICRFDIDGFCLKCMSPRHESERSQIAAAKRLDAQLTVQDLQAANLTPAHLKAMKILAGKLRILGFTVSELMGADFSLHHLKQIGFSASELKSAGCSDEALSRYYTACELKDAGFTLRQLKAAGVWVDQLVKAGYSLREFRSAGFTVQQLRVAEGPNTATEFNYLGFAASQLMDAGCSLCDLKAAGFTISEVRAAGFTISETQDSPYRSSYFTARQCKEAGQSLNEFMAGHSLHEFMAELKATGWQGEAATQKVLKEGFPLSELKDLGIAVSDFKDAGFQASSMVAVGYTAAELKEGRYTARELYQAGCSVDMLARAGFIASELQHSSLS
eukprot:gnl/MRDRNA2_/MRDRNA2_19711_c0_seq1.p1 gnl/MRDRNA2_/MRDRNA2_19711_c0~~gnl/MRDRNA2_/MRDRNA2_19711_c0_seq1.p1  ORF type:complete len:476 (+),score=105.21 gnl/MRDRNA2_/MRDRNA2_19711_c0_seq1:69-1496(+)